MLTLVNELVQLQLTFLALILSWSSCSAYVKSCSATCKFLKPLFLLCPGSLERHETGEVAQAILACCEDSVMAAADSLSAVFEEDTPKQENLDGQSSNSYKIGTLSYSSLAHREKSSHQQVSAQKGETSDQRIAGL